MEKTTKNELHEDLVVIKKLLALIAKQNGAGVAEIGKAMNITQGRVSQLISVKKK